MTFPFGLILIGISVTEFQWYNDKINLLLKQFIEVFFKEIFCKSISMVIIIIPNTFTYSQVMYLSDTRLFACVGSLTALSYSINL